MKAAPWAAPGNTTRTPKSKHATGADRTEDRVAWVGYHVSESRDVLLTCGRLDELGKVLRGSKPVEQMLLHHALLPPTDQSGSQVNDPAYKDETGHQNNPVSEDADAIGIHVASSSTASNA